MDSHSDTTILTSRAWPLFVLCAPHQEPIRLLDVLEFDAALDGYLVIDYHLTFTFAFMSGECKRIAKVEKEKAPCSVDSNLMLDLDATDNMSAVSIDVTVKPDAVGHMMASVADSFVDWHSVDRWAEGDGCWHEEGSYKEVEFQAKCVDMAKVFVRVYVSTVQAVLSQNDMKDIMRTVGNLLPADKKEKRAVQIHDQVFLKYTVRLIHDLHVLFQVLCKITCLRTMFCGLNLVLPSIHGF